MMSKRQTRKTNSGAGRNRRVWPTCPVSFVHGAVSLYTLQPGSAKAICAAGVTLPFADYDHSE